MSGEGKSPYNDKFLLDYLDEYCSAIRITNKEGKFIGSYTNYDGDLRSKIVESMKDQKIFEETHKSQPQNFAKSNENELDKIK